MAHHKHSTRLQEVKQRNATRFSQILASELDATLGTVWQVREDLWMTLLDDYDEHSERFWHPGVSLRQRPPETFEDVIPMLHGTSGADGPVVVRGLTRDKPADHPTSFGHLIMPARVQAIDLYAPDPDAPPPETGRPWFVRHRAARNWWKPRLDPDEHAALAAWAQAKDLL